MKIKKIGWNTFSFSTDNITAITDPQSMSDVGLSFPKSKADICLFSVNLPYTERSVLEQFKLAEKISSEKREKVMEIYTPGEYEVGGLMIRRGIGENFYIVDEKSIRVVYMGGTDNTFDPQSAKDLGDVDVLILPVGDGVNFMSFENIEKVLSYVDPAILIPCAYMESGIKKENIKSKDEFISYFGFGNVRSEGYININKKIVEEDQKSVEVIFLE